MRNVCRTLAGNCSRRKGRANAFGHERLRRHLLFYKKKSTDLGDQMLWSLRRQAAAGLGPPQVFLRFLCFGLEESCRHQELQSFQKKGLRQVYMLGICKRSLPRGTKKSKEAKGQLESILDYLKNPIQRRRSD